MRLILTLLFLLLLLSLASCQADKEPLIQLRDYDKSENSNVRRDDKPLYREVTDEFGIVKGWKF